MAVIPISSTEQFDDIIKSKKLVVIDFFATWCGPCVAISPKFEAFSQDFPNITFIKVDVDSLGSIAQTQQVSAMPTFQFYKDGKKVDELVGADVRSLKAKLDSLNQH